MVRRLHSKLALVNPPHIQWHPSNIFTASINTTVIINYGQGWRTIPSPWLVLPGLHGQPTYRTASRLDGVTISLSDAQYSDSIKETYVTFWPYWTTTGSGSFSNFMLIQYVNICSEYLPFTGALKNRWVPIWCNFLQLGYLDL